MWGSETGTWLYFWFNGLGWLLENSLSVRTSGGARIFVMPKQSGELGGYPLLLPELHVGRPDQAIVITPDGRLPFRPLSRERFLQAEQAYYQAEIDRLQKLPTIPTSVLAQRHGELASITGLFSSMSPEDRQSQAIVRPPINPRSKIFFSEAEGGKKLVTIDVKPFEATGSRTSVNLITVYWELDENSPAKAEMILRFKANFSFQALGAMLGQ